MTYDEKILAYKMTEQDKELAKLADIILRAYNTAINLPADISKGEDVEVRFNTIHTPEGYSFIEFERNKPVWIYTTDKKIEDYIHHVFLTKCAVSNAGQRCSWDKVIESPAVRHALIEHMTYDEKILAYEMTGDDKVLAELLEKLMSTTHGLKTDGLV